MPELVRDAEGHEKMPLSPAGPASAGVRGIPPRLPAWRQTRKGFWKRRAQIWNIQEKRKEGKK